MCEMVKDDSYCGTEGIINYKSQREPIIPFSPDSLKRLSKMHLSLWMQEDFGEIQASFGLREIPMNKPTYIITFLKAKNNDKNTQV